MLRFFAREVNARAGFFLLLIITATPLMSVGAVLMTVDPLSVLFWTAAMLAGWRAVQDNGQTRHWLWVGLWMGLGFLSKYTELLQLLCWAVFFALWRPARKHLRRPGPYLALLVNLLCALPVLIWNAQHGWITVTHVSQDAGMGTPWRFTLRYLGEFLGSETGLLNPIFFGATIWAALAFWRRGRHDPRLVYFFSMGAPVFLVYLGQSFRGRVLPNWIAPAVLPLFCLMVIYWDTRWRLGTARIKALAGHRPHSGLCHRRRLPQHRRNPAVDRLAAAGKPGPAPPGAGVERSCPGRRGGQEGPAGGREAGLHHRRSLRAGRGDFLLPARSQSGRDERPPGFLPDQPNPR